MDETTSFAPLSFLSALVAQVGVEGVVLVLVFGAVALAVIGVAGLAGGGGGAGYMARAGRAPKQAAGSRMSVRAGQGGPGWSPLRLLRPLERSLAPEDLEVRSKMRLRLVQAGYLHPGAVARYYAARFALAVALPVPVLLSLPLLSRSADSNTLLMAASALGLFGYMLPAAWVRIRADRRSEDIRRAFPDALDLMLVCVEAGLGLDAAITRVADELGGTHPVLAEHLRLTSLELRAGQSREEALHNLGRRCGVDEVSAFVTLMIQSQELGTSIGDTLRVYADDMRNARLMRAEEKANQIPVKLALPLVLFLLPAFLGLLMLPVIIRFIRVIDPVAKGIGS